MKYESFNCFVDTIFHIMFKSYFLYDYNILHLFWKSDITVVTITSWNCPCISTIWQKFWGKSDSQLVQTDPTGSKFNLVKSNRKANRLNWEFNIQNKELDLFTHESWLESLLKVSKREKRFNEQTQPRFCQSSLNKVLNCLLTRPVCWFYLLWISVFRLSKRAGLLQLLISARHLSQTNRSRQIVPFEVWKLSSLLVYVVF